MKHLVILLLFGTSLFSQKNDFIWELGNFSQPITPQDTPLFGATRLDFNYDPMRVSFDFTGRKISMLGSNISFSDVEGNLRFLSNRTWIADTTFEAMKGGEKIFKDYLHDIFYPGGDITPQTQLCLPWPDNSDSVILISPRYQYLNLQNKERGNGILHLIISIQENDGLGEVVRKEREMSGDIVSWGRMTGVRHGNGRDWWMVMVSYNDRKLYTYLFTPTGIEKYDEQEITADVHGYVLGQSFFSPDGSQYATVASKVWESPAVIALYDFDRCTGQFSNERMDTIPITVTELNIGLCFSPNNQYLYVSNREEVFQYKTSGDFASSKKKVAQMDGFRSIYGTINPQFNFETDFGYWAPGPDGRLYMTPASGSLWLHKMDYPDEEGEACTFNQHSIRIKSNYQSIPNFVNYRLGPLDGSSCDTLGLNNMPVAKFRYEQDTTDHHKVRFTDLSYYRPESWQWDFGDGATFDGKKPYWHEFPSPGDYNVCLKVANENGEDEVCRIVHIGDPNPTEEIPIEAEISIYPNPVSDYLLITLSDYIPAEGRIELYDMLGRRLVSQPMYYGQNTIDMTTLAAGTYVYKTYDGWRLIEAGKVVKE